MSTSEPDFIVVVKKDCPTCVLVAPDLQPCSIEKVAINAVMAGCKPEYLPGDGISL